MIFARRSSAQQLGYVPPEGSGVAQVIEVLADAHQGLFYRSIPDVEQIMTAKPDKLVRAMCSNVATLEDPVRRVADNASE